MNPYDFKCQCGVKLDPYRIFRIYEVADPAIQHAVKKLLRFGRGNGGKGGRQDVEEAIASLNRWIEMESEDLQPVEKVRVPSDL